MCVYHFLKRTFDIVLSLIGLILSSPVLIILIIAIKFTSRGPAFFKQKRIGRGKKTFVMFKLRTMSSDTPKDTPTHLLKNPYSYITPIGRFLRKTSLDELPQLFNILFGHMSFVGPRPALWNQDDLVAARDKYGANDIRPGLTGVAQISGRDELPIDVKAVYDGQYIRHMGFLFDFKVIIKTFLYVTKSKGVKEGN